MRIGLIGVAGSGKDTTGKFLQEILLRKGIDLAIQKFAAPLKEITAKVFGENFDERDTKEKEVDFLQDKKEKVYSEVSVFLDSLDISAEDKDNFIGYMFDNLLQFADKCSPRKFQQVLGGAGRFVDAEFWVKVQKDKSGIFTDVRFQNEADTMDKLIYVFRPCVDTPAYNKYLSGTLDKSEHFAVSIGADTKWYRYYIHNIGDMEELRDNCIACVDNYLNIN